jgi:hypothetical protein
VKLKMRRPLKTIPSVFAIIGMRIFEQVFVSSIKTQPMKKETK